MRIPIVIFLCVCLFVACEKTAHLPAERPDAAVYLLQDVEFFLSADDGIDSTLQRLDTITFVNNSDGPLPDTTFYPYSSLCDSVSVAVTTPQGTALRFADSISFRHLTIHTQVDGTLTYGQQADSVHFAGFPDTVVMPQRRVQIATTLHPTPRTQYKLTGEYWRVRYSVSFRAKAAQSGSDEHIPIEGKVNYSTVAVSAYEGQTPVPQATILIASDLD
ncbi:hypothetical protein ACFOET_11470 [Parapedobacter deserti]|uniref:DUF4249 family protein n=1 Tax=Parapedobacter deserti TaxID=1912957 RepID=A0ABV7JQ46_9SPHI